MKKNQKPRIPKKHNPKGAKKAEDCSLLYAVGELWHHVKANRPDLIMRAKQYPQSVRNMIAGVCPGKDEKGMSLPISKDTSMLQRDMFNTAMQLQLKVAVNKANNAPKDELQLRREAEVFDHDISVMIDDMEKAKMEGFK